jgi:hypothetical protein
MYYLTVYNEPMVQPAEPEDVDVEGIVRGIHRVSVSGVEGPKVQLLSSGVGVPWALEAQQLLAEDWGVSADVWSVTSWNELRRDALAAEHDALVDPTAEPRTPYVTQQLSEAQGQVFVATSDYDHLVPDQIRAWVPGDYAVLGADGFGFSDTRAAARRHFLIDGPSMVVKTLQQLARRGEVPADVVAKAVEKYRLLDVTAGTSGSAGGEIRSTWRSLRRGVLGLGDRALELGTQRRDRLGVGVQREGLEVLTSLEHAVGLDRGEHQLTPHLRRVLARPPVPHAEAQRLDRHPGVAQDHETLGEGDAVRVALGRGGQAPHRSLVVVGEREPAQLEERAPAARVPGELLGERPHREVGGSLLLQLVVRGAQRVLGAGRLRGPAPHDLGQRVERTLVVRVVHEHGPQRVLLQGVAPTATDGRVPRPHRRCGERDADELAEAGQQSHAFDHIQ